VAADAKEVEADVTAEWLVLR